MSEEYTRVFSLSENLFQSGSPILFEAGDLVKSNTSGNIWARLKMYSVAPWKIRGVKVSLKPYEISGEPLAEVEQQYLDLDVEQGGVFGQTVAIPLSDNRARSFSVSSVEVFFEDHETWQGKNAWTQIFSPKLLEKHFDEELAAQYRRETCADAKYVPETENGLWLCTCGKINRDGEDHCLSCGTSRETVFQSLDTNALRTHLDTYQKEKQNLALAEATAKKKKKALVLSIAAVALVIAAVVGFFVTKGSREASSIWGELTKYTYTYSKSEISFLERTYTDTGRRVKCFSLTINDTMWGYFNIKDIKHEKSASGQDIYIMHYDNHFPLSTDEKGYLKVYHDTGSRQLVFELADCKFTPRKG